MTMLRQLKRHVRRTAAVTLYRGLSRSRFPVVPEDWSPVFLVGCGRSGTTITGTLLSDHPEVFYLNEPRYIWRAIDPRTDVWTPGPAGRGGRLVLDADDCTPEMARRYRAAFHHSLWVRPRHRTLLEKLPVNAFRISYILRAFPTARFVVLHRNGIDVARSMARQPTWFQENDGFRWRELRPLALEAGFEEVHLEACRDGFEKGLVEWTVSVNRILRDLADVPAERICELRYESLLGDPAEGLRRAESHLGLTPSASWLARVREQLRPQRVRPDEAVTLHPRTRELFGTLGYTA